MKRSTKGLNLIVTIIDSLLRINTLWSNSRPASNTLRMSPCGKRSRTKTLRASPCSSNSQRSRLKVSTTLPRHGTPHTELGSSSDCKSQTHEYAITTEIEPVNTVSGREICGSRRWLPTHPGDLSSPSFFSQILPTGPGFRRASDPEREGCRLGAKL